MSADPFVREAREDVTRLSDGLVTLETEGRERETVDELFRRAHSLKGSLGMEGYDEASDLAHAVEDLLDAVRAGEVDPEGEVIDRGLDAVDALDEVLTEVERTGEPTTDREATVAALRDAVATARSTRAETGAGDDGRAAEDGDAAGDDDPDIDALLADAEVESTDGEMTAEEALDAASGFDDLDALAAEVDDAEAAAYEGLEGGGSMPAVEERDGEADDVGEAETGEVDGESVDTGETDEEDEITEVAEADETEPTEPAEADETDDSGFASVKADVDDDDTSIEDLEAEIADETFGEFDDDDEMSIEELIDLDPDAEPPAEAEPVDEPTPAVDDGAGEAAEADDAAAEGEVADDGATGAGKQDEFAWVRDTVEVEDSVEDLEAEIADEAFGEFDDDDEMSIEELIDLDPSEEPPKETDLKTVTLEPESDREDEPVEPEPTMDEPEPTADEPVEPETTDEPEPADTPAAPTDPVGDLAAELDADRGEVAAVVDDLTGPNQTAADVAPETVEAELAAAEAELESIAAELDAVDLEGETEPTAGPRFERDSELEAFESRFEGLFDRDTDEDRDRRAVGTLAESSVDPVVYRRDREDDDRDWSTAGDVGSLTVDVENADELLSLVEELSVHARRLDEELAARPASDPVSRALSALASTTRDLQRTVMDVRLMPLSTVTGGLSRVVRDVTREGETEASLTVEGEDVRLDRSIIDRLGDPIVHLVRNAVDHGVEPADEREAAGKPREGTVELRARREGSEVVVEVEDDGRGVDVDAVRERAVERGLVDADADLPESEVLACLFHPGFSTATEVTKTSGRGVGLDVVHEVAEALNGDVTVETEPGEGTTVRLRLPVSVATLEVLFVEAGGERYALPVDAIEHVGREGGARIAGGGEDGLLTPELTGDVVDLAAAMGGAETGDDAAVVRVGRADGSVALRCDRVLNTRDVVISPYDDLLAEVPGVTGTTMTDDGRLVNVVDVERMDVAATEDL
jgi:two-component system chemotaxis sensor kinase CheA